MHPKSAGAGACDPRYHAAPMWQHALGRSCCLRLSIAATAAPAAAAPCAWRAPPTHALHARPTWSCMCTSTHAPEAAASSKSAAAAAAAASGAVPWARGCAAPAAAPAGRGSRSIPHQRSSSVTFGSGTPSPQWRACVSPPLALHPAPAPPWMHHHGTSTPWPAHTALTDTASTQTTAPRACVRVGEWRRTKDAARARARRDDDAAPGASRVLLVRCVFHLSGDGTGRQVLPPEGAQHALHARHGRLKHALQGSGAHSAGAVRANVHRCQVAARREIKGRQRLASGKAARPHAHVPAPLGVEAAAQELDLRTGAAHAARATRALAQHGCVGVRACCCSWWPPSTHPRAHGGPPPTCSSTPG